MMRFTVFLTKDAASDLADIYDYVLINDSNVRLGFCI
jgi:plasmid stabilization system protein ParE